jgi:hypothetical protein
LESGLNECGIITDHPQQQTDEAAIYIYIQKRINTKFQPFAQQTLPVVINPGWAYFMAVSKCVAKFDIVTRNHLRSVSVKLRFLLQFAPDIH